MTTGVRAVVRSDDGLILAVRSGDGFDLPGGAVGDDEAPKAAAARYLLEQCGLAADPAAGTPAFRGKGDVFEWTSSYTFAGVDHEEACGEGVAWVGIHEILCGPDGLYARDLFNRLGWMNRPALSLDRLYKLTKVSLNDRARRDGAEIEGVDAVIDEITFLTDIGKVGAVDAILRRADCERLHANILDAFVSMVEEMHGLKERDAFVQRARARIALIDSSRTKMRLVVAGQVVSEDVRGDAAKIYKERAREFGRMLREGTLGKWMEKRREQMFRMVEENKAKRQERRDEPSSPDPSESEKTREKPSLSKLRYGTD